MTEASDRGPGDETGDQPSLAARPGKRHFHFLQGGGEAGALIRRADWLQTPLDSPESWPQSLRSAVSICLGSGFPIALYWGPQLTLIYNDAWSPIPGAKHPWALGRTAREVWPEIWDSIGPLFHQVMTTGEATRSKDQLLAMRRHGYTEECYFDYTFSPIWGESGEVEGIFNAVLETTERVIGERRSRLVREVAERLSEARTAELACSLAAETIARAAADIPFALIYLLSADGMALDLAGTAGVAPGSDAAPQRVPLSAPSGEPGGGVWPLAQVSFAGVPELVENLDALFAPLPGGPWPEHPHSAVVLPLLRAGRERPYGAFVAGLSPRRALDSEYRAFLETLTSTIAQSLANANIYEEERKRAAALIEIDRAKTAFFSNVSHEFRTPLTLMLGPLQELLDMLATSAPPLPGAAGELVSIAHRNCLRLQKLVNTLLDFSRIEAGRAEPSPEPLDLAALTVEIASTFRSAIEKAHLQFVVDCPPLPKPVYVDREMWEKIVLNLLSNAFKFTWNGAITVRLRQIAEESGEQIILTVEDSGCGIPEHDLPRIFDRFTRVEGTRGRTQEGSGIGLAMVAELVKLHRGTITVRSTPGQGSVFTISLPANIADAPLPSLSSAQSGAPATSLLDFHPGLYVEEASGWLPAKLPTAPDNRPGGRVLVADDNADMRDYVSRILSTRWQVETAANGEEALAQVRASRPDLLVADLMMPVMDGFGLLQALRADPTTRSLPVIFLSARAGEEAAVEGLEAGADGYLAKPLTARELLARVGAQMQMTQLRKQAAEREAVLRAEAEAARDTAIRVLESISDGFFTLDADWRLRYMNAAGEELLRGSREELLGRTNWEVYPDLLGTIAEHEFRRAARDRVPVEFEIFYTPWQRWFAVKAYPVQEGGISVYFRDITTAKEADGLLREKQQRLRAIYDGTYEYIGLLTPDGTLIEANRASLEFAGNAPADVLGLPFWETPWFAATPGASEAVRQAVQRAAAGEFVRFDATLIRPSGEAWDFDISFHPIFNAEGQVELIVPECRNITEQNKDKERLRQQWRMFDTVLSNVPDLLYIYDLQGRFAYVNRAVVSRSQRPLEKTIGKTVLEVGYPPELGARLQQQIQSVIDTGQPVRGQTPWQSPEGEIRHFEYNFAAVRSANGNVEAVAGSSRDVTEQKLAEERELKRQTQLRDSARLESLGVLAGGIAHDFNNLLTGILGNASLLVETSDESNLLFAKEIVSASERAAELTKQMLAYSGKGSFVIEVVDLNQLVRENLALIRASLSRTVTVELDLDCDACLVEADRTQLHQVIMNLLINASEAVGELPGKVTVRSAIVERRAPQYSEYLHTSVRAGQYALLEVRDDGAGMTADTLRKIFDPFFTTKFTGRGLGLAAVLGIVKGHHGDIEVESEPGAGTVFRVFLPVSKQAVQPAHPDSVVPDARAAAQTVLVVDDEAMVRSVAKTVLERAGFHVITAGDGAEALDILRTRSEIAVVILDLTMPVMTGEQVLPLIRERHPKIPVILSSGFSEAEISRRFSSAGLAGVLQKPYKRAHILSMVANAIRSTASPR